MSGATVLRYLQARHFAGLVDQGVVALCRFLFVVIFARHLESEEFGVLALVITGSYFLMYLQRALVSVPFVNNCVTEELLNDAGPEWVFLNLVLALGSGALLAILAAITSASNTSSWYTVFFLISSLAGPACLIYEFSRRWLFQFGDFKAAIGQGVCFAGLWTIAIALFIMAPSLELATSALTIPYLASALLFFFFRPPARLLPRALMRTWREAWPFTKWMFAEALVRSMPMAGIQFWLAIVLGPTAAAIYTSGRNVAAPVGSLLSAVEIFELPRMARAHTERGAGGLIPIMWHVFGFLAFLALPFLTLVGLFNVEVLTIAYGADYAAYTSELNMWIAVTALIAIGAPFEMWLLTSRASKALFGCRAAGALVTVLSAILFITWYGVLGAILSIAVGSLITTLLSAVAVARDGSSKRKANLDG